jgi:hypothetical protein
MARTPVVLGEKPPLLMWCTAFFFHLFGVTEFWSRVAQHAVRAQSGLAFSVLRRIFGHVARSSSRLPVEWSAGIFEWLVLRIPAQLNSSILFLLPKSERGDEAVRGLYRTHLVANGERMSVA